MSCEVWVFIVVFLLLQFCTYGQLLELKLLAFLSGTLHILQFISTYCANKWWWWWLCRTIELLSLVNQLAVLLRRMCFSVFLIAIRHLHNYFNVWWVSCWSILSHTCTVVREYCKDDDERLLRIGKYDPPQLLITYLLRNLPVTHTHTHPFNGPFCIVEPYLLQFVIDFR